MSLETVDRFLTIIVGSRYGLGLQVEASNHELRWYEHGEIV